jgi:hypothetical protein
LRNMVTSSICSSMRLPILKHSIPLRNHRCTPSKQFSCPSLRGQTFTSGNSLPRSRRSLRAGRNNCPDSTSEQNPI